MTKAWNRVICFNASQHAKKDNRLYVEDDLMLYNICQVDSLKLDRGECKRKLYEFITIFTWKTSGQSATNLKWDKADVPKPLLKWYIAKAIHKVLNRLELVTALYRIRGFSFRGVVAP